MNGDYDRLFSDNDWLFDPSSSQIQVLRSIREADRCSVLKTKLEGAETLIDLDV